MFGCTVPLLLQLRAIRGCRIVTFFRTALFCLGGASVGTGYGAFRRGKPNGRLYLTLGILLVVAGLLLYVF